MAHEPQPVAPPRRSGLGRILGLARSEAKTLAAGLLFLLVGSAATLAFPKAVEVIIESSTAHPSPDMINGAALAMLALFAVQAASGSIRYRLFTGAGERIVAELRIKLFTGVLSQEVAFFDRNRTGELLSRLSNDTQVLQNTVSVNVSMLLRNLVSALGGILLLFTLSWKLTLVMMLVVPPVALGAALFGRRVRRFSKEAQDALASAGEIAEESLSGIRTVRAFNQEPTEAHRYGQAVHRSLEAAMRRVTNIALFSGGGALFGGIAIAAVLWAGGRMAAAGELSIGVLSSFLLYSLIVAFSLGALTDLWGDFMKAAGAAERVFELLDRQPALADGQSRLPEPLQGAVEFQGVHFSYPTRPDIPVLRGLDLHLKAGERVALVGPSGAGKSTLTALLLRFYDPLQGKISIDGVDARNVAVEHLRDHMALVSQEPLLMSASIEDNIRYGRASASRQEVAAAATLANADDFIRSFPEGYRTPVGERGAQLSGGQKQRVAIARAVIRDPRILILDEATSALDAESEYLVKQALERLMKGRTTLIIAHRLSTVRDADRVAVLEQGQVVESGAHQQLMQQDGMYRRLVERQFSEEVRPSSAPT